jgi:hypothetical protein
VTCRLISRKCPKYGNATIENILQQLFYVVCAMPIARQRIAKHIPAEANARNNRRCIDRQRRGKQALSTIQVVFSVESAQSDCKRVEFQTWELWKNEKEYIGVQRRTTVIAAKRRLDV